MKRLSIYVITMVLTCAVAAVLARVAAHRPHFVATSGAMARLIPPSNLRSINPP
jgi:hypothetical protein